MFDMPDQVRAASTRNCIVQQSKRLNSETKNGKAAENKRRPPSLVTARKPPRKQNKAENAATLQNIQDAGTSNKKRETNPTAQQCFSATKADVHRNQKREKITRLQNATTGLGNTQENAKPETKTRRKGPFEIITDNQHNHPKKGKRTPPHNV